MSYDNQADISLADLNEERIVNLPDLSDFQESEKKHIVSVLLRNEDLRDKHLARFMNIRKEVADLEQQPAPTSPQVCARCLTQFGMLFNTGDPCPKCGAKVCKQCRRMYNVNDNNWLCKLCCKHMQLLSYSGEWIYALHSNLRKPSTSPSEIRGDSFPLSVSTQNINMISSSDSEPEDSTKTAKPDRSSTKSVTNQTAKKKAKPKDKSRPLIVQNAVDEQKLKYLKERMKERPLNSPHTQPLPRRNPKINSPNHTMKSSSDAINSLTNNSQDGTLNKTKPPANKQLDYLKVREKPLDLISVTSSEWNFDDDDDDEIDIEMENIKRSQADLSQPSIRNNRSSVSSTATVKKARHKRISSSVHNLREKMHRIPHPHLSSSRTSLNSQKTTTSEMPVRSNINNEDTISIKVNDIPLKSEPDTTQITGEVSVDEPEPKPKPKSESIPAVKSRHGSVNTVASTKVTGSQPLARHVSTTESVASARTDLTRQDSRPDSIGRFSSVIDSDDDIDQTVTKTKLGSKKANSLRDLRGSHLSLTTLMSEAKARFGLQITGTIELKVSYHKNTGSLDIYIKQCLNLAAAKHNKTSDPYCKIYLLPDRSKNSKRKTTVRKGTTSPVFAEILRYHLSEKEFGDRILWISVWSETSLGHNEFLGEINLPLATCQFDGLQEYTLLPRIEPEEETTPPVEQAVQKPEIKFDLIFLPNTNNKEIGIIQVNNIQAKGITYHGKSDIEVVCKGTLMPDKVKKKSPGLGRGPSPKWDLPLRWENIRLKDIKNTSMQISIWTLERFRKSMIGFVNLNTTRGHSDDKNVKMLNSEEREKIVWEKFLKDPTKNNEIRLPLRLSPNAKT